MYWRCFYRRSLHKIIPDGSHDCSSISSKFLCPINCCFICFPSHVISTPAHSLTPLSLVLTLSSSRHLCVRACPCLDPRVFDYQVNLLITPSSLSSRVWMQGVAPVSSLEWLCFAKWNKPLITLITPVFSRLNTEWSVTIEMSTCFNQPCCSFSPTVKSFPLFNWVRFFIVWSSRALWRFDLPMAWHMGAQLPPKSPF